MSSKSDINAATGVNYNGLDTFKVLAQRHAALTDRNLRYSGCTPISWSRGESIFLFQGPDGMIWGHVHEGLGTKNLAADDAVKALGKNFYRAIGQDTVAMGVNDAITLGLRPVAVSMHLSVPDASWFDDHERAENLASGFAEACNLAMCAWSCGETPALGGIIVPGAAELSCSVIGVAEKEEHVMNPGNIRAGDAIMFLESSGIHANGLTTARRVAAKLPHGYQTLLAEGTTYGDALLTPTNIYVSFMRKCQEQGIILHYAVNITGHGLRKLMRASEPFCYFVDCLPKPVHPELLLIQQVEELTDEQMYAAFNMGAGFALYVQPEHVPAVVNAAEECGIVAWKGGEIRPSAESEVVLVEKGIHYKSETLEIRV